MRIDILILIVGMGIVTYIPRALPVLFIEKIKFGDKVEKFLKLIPYTAMAALIFPGVLYVDEDYPLVGILGGVVAVILGLKKLPVMICVLGAILTSLLIYLFTL